MSTIDNPSAQLAIALQLRDLDELEASGTIDKLLIRLQRQQLEIDSGFDAVTFEASRRLAVSMAKAVEDDSAVLAQSTLLPQIDDAMFDRLASLNHLPTIAAKGIESVQRPGSADLILSSKTGSRKRARSLTPEHESSSSLVSRKDAELPSCSHATLDHAGHRPKKPKVGGEQISGARKSGIQVESGEMSLVQETTAPTNAIEIPSSTADCASCSDPFTIDELVKASCEHYYCRDCFGHFMEASLQTDDGFPPKCCKIPIAFNTVAANVSAPLFGHYSARQARIKNATALYCGIQGCGVRIEKDRINKVKATCIACWRDTCTKCRNEFPRNADDKNVDHVCKVDKAREEVLALAKQEGWQTCYRCGNLIALNFGCHHMRSRCEAEFCYRCGTKWKNCECGDYDEPRLQARAVRGIDMRAARRVAYTLPPDPRPREQQLAELETRLQVECDHNNFSYECHTRRDPERCEICEYRGWKFIFRCDTCRFTACRNCHNFHGWNRGATLGEVGPRYHDADTDDEHFTEDESNEE